MGELTGRQDSLLNRLDNLNQEIEKLKKSVKSKLKKAEDLQKIQNQNKDLILQLQKQKPDSKQQKRGFTEEEKLLQEEDKLRAQLLGKLEEQTGRIQKIENVLGLATKDEEINQSQWKEAERAQVNVLKRAKALC